MSNLARSNKLRHAGFTCFITRPVPAVTTTAALSDVTRTGI